MTQSETIMNKVNQRNEFEKTKPKKLVPYITKQNKRVSLDLRLTEDRDYQDIGLDREKAFALRKQYKIKTAEMESVDQFIEALKQTEEVKTYLKQKQIRILKQKQQEAKRAYWKTPEGIKRSKQVNHYKQILIDKYDLGDVIEFTNAKGIIDMYNKLENN